MKQLRTIVAAATLLFAGSSSADTVLGIYLGAGFWQAESSGSVRYVGNDINVNDDLGWNDNTNGYFFIALEHFVPGVPNFKLSRTTLELDGSSTLTQNITFGNTTYTASTAITSNTDFSHTDLNLYYEILDNWLNLDLGVTIRLFDGTISVSSTTTNETRSFDAPIPMAYGKAQFDLPLTGFYAGGEINFIGYDGNSLSDFKLTAGYESDVGLGAEIGYRSFKIKFDDIDGVYSDLTFDGVFGNVFFHF